MLLRKIWLPLSLAGVLAGAAVYWAVLNPDNPLIRLFQNKISDTDARIIVGPYPNERDFRLLKANKVGLIVSLLNSNIPYEKVLIAREKELASRYQITLVNFPMTSIFGHKFGDHYQGSAQKAAGVIAGTSDKVYLHCYLGIHRVQTVIDLLKAKGMTSDRYAVRPDQRDESTRRLDAAQAAFDAGKYQQAIDTLSQISQISPNGRLLLAWSQYRLGNVKEARATFQALLGAEPGNAPATKGLGYCALRDGDLPTSERLFGKVLSGTPQDAEALGGMGLTCYRAGRIPDAIRYLDEALRIEPNNPELRDVLDRARGQTGKTPSAERR